MFHGAGNKIRDGDQIYDTAICITVIIIYIKIKIKTLEILPCFGNAYLISKYFS